MKILIADDHLVLRAGLKQVLADEFEDVVFGETGTTDETIEAIHREPWDVVLLDLNMPGRGGLAVLEKAHRELPDLPILVFSSTPEDQMAVRMLKAGAAGYINKQAVTDELAVAIRKVVEAGHYVSPGIVEQLAREIGKTERPSHESLSNREFEVFEMMARGKSVKQIASDLSLSPKTVSTFRSRIFSKLDVRNDIELARYIHVHGLFGSNRDLA